MAAAEWSKYGNAGGWQLPPKKQANQQRGMMPDYYNQLDQGRAARSGGGMNYNNVIPTREQWESFSKRNKENAKVMHLAQQQGNVSMDKLKQRSSSIGAGMGLKSPSPLSGYGSPSFREKYNAGAALKANKDNSLADNMRDENAGITVGQFGDYFDAVRETQGGGGGGAWYDDLWKEAKGLGIKGWGEIGIGAMNAYTGWQETEMAKKQHGLAQETFDFQKAAYNKDREGRVLAYNTNAQNVNAWKEAQGRTDLNKLMV